MHTTERWRSRCTRATQEKPATERQILLPDPSTAMPPQRKKRRLPRGTSPRAPLTLFRCLRTPFSKCFPNAPPQRLLSFADRCVRRGTRLIRLRALHGRNCLLATEYWLPRSKKPRAPRLSLVKWSRRTRLFFPRNARQPRGDSLPGAWLF